MSRSINEGTDIEIPLASQRLKRGSVPEPEEQFGRDFHLNLLIGGVKDDEENAPG
jgi:hypothetical protein